MPCRFLNQSIKFYLLIFLVSFTGGCYFFSKPAGKSAPNEVLQRVGWLGRPTFHDDLDKESLLAAIEKNNIYLNRLPGNRVISYGDKKYTVNDVKKSFNHFTSILKESKSGSELHDRVTKDFDIYRPVEDSSEKKVLFTGYYEPIMKGNSKRSGEYQYPIYAKPDDLFAINLGNFRKGLKGKKIIARIENGAVVPYYDRKSIDGFGLLLERGLEIAWLSDLVDVFFLHVQGSGIVEMTDGSKLNVNYAAANGREYRSIGRFMIKEGMVPKEMMSMKSIREYLKSNPGEMEKILFYNESYVFFRVVDEGPIGSTGVPVTAKRSIAADGRIFPKGGLAFIQTEVPVTDAEGVVTEWKKISRFVVDQDSGGAIKGPGRIDIFFGTGDEAAMLAGNMNREGKIFYLIKKEGRKSF